MDWTLAAGAGLQLTASMAPVLGALHALEPGHGKSLVAAYLVGAGGRIVDAVVLGIVVTLTHTSAAIALGLAVVLFGNAVSTPAARQMLQIVSASLVLLIGAWMFRSLARRSGRHHQHDHPHEHHHGEHSHQGDHPHERKRVFGRGGLIGLGVSGGLVPCPAALTVAVSVLGRANTWTALGTVLLFSAGMGAVLTGIAIAFVRFGQAAERRSDGRIVRRLPLVSAALVTLLGAALLVMAIWFPSVD